MWWSRSRVVESGRTSGRGRHPARTGFTGNPFFVFGPEPHRQQRIRSFILRQHRSGRPLAEIVLDPRVRRLRGGSLSWAVLVDPATIGALGRDANDESRSCLTLGEAGLRRPGEAQSGIVPERPSGAPPASSAATAA